MGRVTRREFGIKVKDERLANAFVDFCKSLKIKFSYEWGGLNTLPQHDGLYFYYGEEAAFGFTETSKPRALFGVSNFDDENYIGDLHTDWDKLIRYLEVWNDENKTRPDKYVTIVLNDEYTAKVYEDRIVVDCQTFPKEKLEELLEQMNIVEGLNQKEN